MTIKHPNRGISWGGAGDSWGDQNRGPGRHRDWRAGVQSDAVIAVCKTDFFDDASAGLDSLQGTGVETIIVIFQIRCGELTVSGAKIRLVIARRDSVVAKESAEEFGFSTVACDEVGGKGFGLHSQAPEAAAGIDDIDTIGDDPVWIVLQIVVRCPYLLRAIDAQVAMGVAAGAVGFGAVRALRPR